jgi:hypothetical protein
MSHELEDWYGWEVTPMWVEDEPEDDMQKMNVYQSPAGPLAQDLIERRYLQAVQNQRAMRESATRVYGRPDPQQMLKTGCYVLALAAGFVLTAWWVLHYFAVLG